MRCAGKYDAARVRPVLVPIAAVLGALALSACGSDGIEPEQGDPLYEGAVLFAERCSGCHTLSSAGTQGSGARALRPQGPNLDQREESFEDVLFAIQNGGFSGAIMPQNIVVGEEAEQVARFVAETSGSEVGEESLPSRVEDEDAAAEESGNPPSGESPTAAD